MTDPQQPAVPPVPPVVPQAPAIPQYGEYAPGYPQQAPTAPPPPAYSPYSPQPAYPQQPTSPQAAYPGAQYGYAPQPAGPKRRVWDLVLTIILLVLGFFGTIGAILYAVLFSNAELLDEYFRQQGLDGFDGTVGSGPLILAVSHIVLFLAALGLSILGLVKRWVIFYVPLIAGVIAAVIFWGVIISIVFSDPAIMDMYNRA